MAPISVDRVDGKYSSFLQAVEAHEPDVDQIKDVIQDLFQIQAAAHGYAGPQTQQELIRLMYGLSSYLVGSLSTLSRDASTLPTQIPPEIIDYVDEGRNPDIYTREFVELVQKGNQYLKGKSEAFAGFRDALADEIAKAWPDMEKDVESVLEGKEAQFPVKVNGTSS
ncbi:MAG: hypothetical protein LQ338_006298 [Usnochroma carphineum]|nr:MAG: hypothetical protein LQ338_006298 [Usnochroma carphineum]